MKFAKVVFWGAGIDLNPRFSFIGGGSTPDRKLPTHLMSIKSSNRSAASVEKGLRKPHYGVPVLARIAGDRVILDLRTVFADEEPALADALVAALA